MKRVPKVGTRVCYRGAWVTKWGGEAVTGTVTAIYPRSSYDENTGISTRLPESEWHVGVRVDTRPSWWPYPSTDSFAPAISDLRKPHPEDVQAKVAL